MSSASPDTQSAAESGQKTGWYVYGILPGDVELTEEVYGVGDSEVSLVRSGHLAALVSEVDLSRPLGSPDDLEAHQDILDSIVTGSPVLPLRFGAVLASEDAVAEELLEEHRDEFAAALEELEGRVEYRIRGRFAERAVLEEILSQDPEAAQLREQIRGKDADATREERIRLGEVINHAIEAKREEDTRALLARMADQSVASAVREPTHELDAVHVAFLVEADKADELEQAAEDLAAEWEGRVELRVLGPMAPYDFVGTSQEAQD
jgi:Gas vesicle synthesis protein GvpL/GvpF